MKKILLTMLVCLVCYTGVNASNEIVENTILIGEKEMLNSFNTVKFEGVQIDNTGFIYNCFVTVIFIDDTGEQVEMEYETAADNEEHCWLKIDNFINLFLSMGYNVIYQNRTYVP